MSLKHDIHNRSHCDFEIHVKMTGVNRPWGKSTTPNPDFPQALFTRVNIPAKGWITPNGTTVRELTKKEPRMHNMDQKATVIWPGPEMRQILCACPRVF